MIATARIATWKKQPIKFVDDVLVHPNGRSYGRSMDPWQRDDMQAVLSTPKNVYRELPRGHAKTLDAAATAATELVLAGRGQRIYFTAADRDQAGLGLDSLRSFIRGSEFLTSICRVLKSEVVIDDLDNVLTVLPADAAGSWGLRPSRVVVDELQAWRGAQAEEFFYALHSSMGKVPNARMLVITTSGWDKTSLCWRLREQIVNDPSWLFIRRGQCASWISQKFLDEQKRLLPAHVFAMLHMNTWTEAGGEFLTHEEVNGIFDPHSHPVEAHAGPMHYISLDLGLSHDATVAAVLHREGTTVIVDNLASWQGSPKQRVNLDDVETWLRNAAKSYTPCRVIADPWQAVGLMQRLSASGIKAQEVKFSQPYRDSLFANLLELVRSNRLRCYPHEQLKKELLQLKFTEKNGTLRVDHPTSGTDDHAVAVAMACLEAVKKRETAAVNLDGNNDLRKAAGSYYDLVDKEYY